MKVSYNWVQSHIEEQLPPAVSLRETIIFHAFEVEEMESAHDDTVFEVKVLPDRAGDCLSHRGIAREIVGLLGLTLKPLQSPALPSGDIGLPIEIQSDKCRRYIAVRIDGVEVKDSPEWLKARLTAVGQKTINNIVDATNFVLLDSGQPIHAFDAKKIDGGIVVRNAKEHESIITLSEEQKTLQATDVVIADYVGSLAIAGVKGGKTAEVDATTTSIILEIANFDPVAVRKTSRRLGLITDASKRFENNVSPALAQDAATHVVSLIQSIANGSVVGSSEYYPMPVQERVITFTTADIQRLTGNSITETDIANVFDRYKYTYVRDGETWTFTIPVWRADITGVHDIVEEVGRAVGYARIPTAALPNVFVATPNPTYDMIRKTKQYLVQNGFSEVLTYTFRKKGELSVSYGPKDKSALRTNLSDALKDSYELNRLNAPLLGVKAIKIFEIGTVFSSSNESIHVATVDSGTVQEVSLEDFYAANKDAIDAVVVPETTHTGTFIPWSAYPFIVRDIAVWVSDMNAQETLEEIMQTFADEYCVRPAYKIDTFTKDGRTSIAYRLVYQSNEKTLQDADVEAWHTILCDRIAAQKQFEIR